MAGKPPLFCAYQQLLLSIAAMLPVKVVVFADIICPWCYVGALNLAEAVRKTGATLKIEYRPFLLHASLPQGEQIESINYYSVFGKRFADVGAFN